ncbi:MBL fold metallo-hydrolase [Methanoregula sp.]|uniref:MBL fold metallo-hydrolase n=1 Tax=Methanoregula sp. TaxID=2052170 RepID=UPI003BB00F4F
MNEPTSPAGSLVCPIPVGHANAYLIRGTRPVLVDCGLPGSAPKILSALTREGLKPWDLALIIITHAHVGHYGSAAALVGATGAPVLVHAREADYLAKGASAPALPDALIGHMLGLFIGRHAPQPELAVQPVIRIDAPYRLDAFGVNGTIIPTPGHTNGSLSVILATGECIAGDLVMGMFPAGRPRLPIFAEDPEAAKKSIRTIIGTKPEIIHTGHGGPFSCGQVEALLT